MTRSEFVNEFIAQENEKAYLVEPPARYPFVRDNLIRALDTHNPSVVIKAGVGAGDLLLDIAERVDRCIVIEPSMPAVESFHARIRNDDRARKIDLVNGNFNLMPVDYFKADMLVCVDYFDFIHSASSMEEFKRAIQFEGFFFFGGVVLSDDDVEGVYDELVRLINPIHVDYYLAGDFRTFMKLKDFTLISDLVERFPINIEEYIGYCKNFSDVEITDKKKIMEYIEQERPLLESLYGLDGSLTVNEYYLTGVYRKNKFTETPPNV
jgi:hypothetical protein